MAYIHLVSFHLATLFPAMLIGSYLLVSHKGTAIHKLLGKTYMLLMLLTAGITLLMKAQVGPTFIGHFGWIHLLSIVTMYYVVSAFVAVRNGNIKRHRNAMVGLYIGGFVIAGAFAFMPSRLLHAYFIS